MSGFIKGRDLMDEIWKSKLSYCEIIDPDFTIPDAFVQNLADVDAKTVQTVCVVSPLVPKVEAKFPTFVVYRVETDGSLRPTVRSHQKRGRMTERLGRMLYDLTIKYSRHASWRGYSWIDDFTSEAILNLTINGLMFNEAKTNNPHAYFTQCIKTSFIKELNKNKTQSKIKDAIRLQNGLNPSFAVDDQ